MTTAAIVVALAMAACFGPLAALLADRLPPRHATWLISVGSVASALSALGVLALLASDLVGQLPLFAHEGHWSGAALRHHELTEPGVAATAMALLLAAVVGLALAARRLGLAWLAAYRASSEMTGELVVLAEGPAQAAAVPGRPGRVVVAESLLAALSAGERRALLAHERAHLAHGHHWHRGAVALAAAANPLLHPLRAAVVYSTERWADEDAAAVGERRDVATALARVALLSQGSAAAARLALAAEAVPARVTALLARPPRARPLLIAVLGVIPLIGIVAVAILLEQTDRLFDLAAHVYAVSHAA
jgi:Zn-dependent protease with chaperone function